jgi:hypothetical protein
LRFAPPDRTGCVSTNYSARPRGNPGVGVAFDVPSLGYANAYADDLSDCFNFNQTPIPFKAINAP